MTKKLRLVKKLDLSKFTPDQLEYFCSSDDIDREVMRRKGKTYNEELAFKSLYFVVTVDKRVTVVQKGKFDPWLDKWEISEMEDQSDAAKEAMNWFIEDVHGVKTLDKK